MPIVSLCAKKTVSLDKNATLLSAAQLMKRENVGSVVITESGSNGSPIGILTDRDIALNAYSNGTSASTAVGQIMSKKIVSVPDTQGIAETVDAMERSGVRRVIVQDSSKKLCGVVSSDDIFQLLAREMSGLGRLVQKQSGTYPPFQ